MCRTPAPGAAPQPWCRCPSSLQTLPAQHARAAWEPSLQSMQPLQPSHCPACPSMVLAFSDWGKRSLVCAGLLTPQSDIPSFIFLHCVTDTAVCPVHVCAYVCRHLCSHRTTTGVSPCPPSCLKWGLSVWTDAQLPGRSAPTGPQLRLPSPQAALGFRHSESGFAWFWWFKPVSLELTSAFPLSRLSSSPPPFLPSFLYMAERPGSPARPCILETVMLMLVPRSDAGYILVCMHATSTLGCHTVVKLRNPSGVPIPALGMQPSSTVGAQGHGAS